MFLLGKTRLLKNMGIESFSTILKNHAPEATFHIPLTQFRGKRISIDTTWLSYLMMAPATKEVLSRTNLAEGKPNRDEIEKIALPRILERLEIFLYYGITPVCVFDGIPHPIKRDGNPKKKEQRRKAREKYQEAKKNLYSKDILLRNYQLVDAFSKQYTQNTKLRRSFVKQLKDILKGIGIPVLEAQEFQMMSKDGEALCATLCLEGNDHCYGAYTIDSDFHAYGGNIQLREVYSKDVTVNGEKNREWFAEVRMLERILDQMTISARKINPQLEKFTFGMFQDLCILLGNDFNTNIPRKGPAGSWKAILQYYSIPNMSKYENVEILKYETGIEMFKSTICKIDPGPIDFDFQKFRETGRTILELYDLNRHILIITNLIDQFKLIMEEYGNESEQNLCFRIIGRTEKQEENLAKILKDAQLNSIMTQMSRQTESAIDGMVEL